MRYAIRDLAGAEFELGVEGGRWVSGGEGPVVDLRRWWAVGGLADAHAHLSQDDMVFDPGDPAAIGSRAMVALDSGVFLCLDKGWRDAAVLEVLSEPPDRRPDIQAAGRMIAGVGGYYPGFCIETDDDGLASAVAEAADGAGGWVKLIGDWPRRGRGAVANFGEEAVSAAVAVAHRAGARVAIHTMAPDVASMAVRAGVDSIEHGLFLTDADIAVLGARGGAWVPTVLRMEQVIEQVGLDRTGGRLVAEGLSRVRSQLTNAVAAGVHVLAGSDLAVPSSQVAHEALRLLDYGLDPQDVVASITEATRAFAGLAPSFTVGETADVVAFDRNPCEDPTVLLEPVVVVRGGGVRRGPADDI